MPLSVFDTKGIPATRRERSKPLSSQAASMFSAPTNLVRNALLHS